MNLYTKEIWKEIDGFSDYYVSNYGRVKSLKCGKERILAQGEERGGYLHTILSKNGKSYIKKTHQLVAYAFPEICGEWFKGAEVNHKDENKKNNNADNLEWCSHKYNNNYGCKTERMLKNRAGKNKCKQVSQLNINGDIINKYSSVREAARALGFNPSYISMCCRGLCKIAYGYKWNYNN